MTATHNHAPHSQLRTLTLKDLDLWENFAKYSTPTEKVMSKKIKIHSKEKNEQPANNNNWNHKYDRNIYDSESEL